MGSTIQVTKMCSHSKTLTLNIQNGSSTTSKNEPKVILLRAQT